MAESQVKTGIVVEGDAKGGIAALKSVTKEAAKMRIDTKKLGDGINSLPDKLGKASTGLLLFQNSMSQMGGKVADAANKLTAIAGIAATGGPLGIALAGLTAAAIAGSAAWEAYNADVVAAENATKSLAKIFDESDKRMQQRTASLEELTKQLENFGKTTREIQLESLRAEIALTEQSRDIKQQEIAQMFRQAAELQKQAGLRTENSEAIRQEADHLVRTAMAMEEGVKRGEQIVEINRKRIETLEAMTQREQQAERATARRQERQRKAAEDAKVAAAEQLDMMRAIDDARKAFAESERMDIDRNAQARIAAIEQEQQIALENARIQDQLMTQRAQKNAETTAQAIHLASQAAEVIVDTEMSANQKSLELMKMGMAALRDAVLKRITTYAVEAAAGGMSKSVAQLGPFGLIVGAGVAAAAFAAVMAFAQKLNTGGFVRDQQAGFVAGGMPGRDSTMAALTPGELVASTGEVQGIRKFLSRLVSDDKARDISGMVGMGGTQRGDTRMAAANQTVIINPRTWVPDRTEELRMARRLGDNTARRLRVLGAQRVV